jgi:CheY-like chemotaxis protein
VSTRSVLIVEDDRDIRETLEEALREDGFSVASAANGLDALAMLPRLRRPCAIVLDMIMPLMSGREFYEAMRSDDRFRDIPVLVATSDPARAPGGVLTLKKPVDLSTLISTVRSFFDDAGPAGGERGGKGPIDRPGSKGGGQSARTTRRVPHPLLSRTQFRW